MKIKGENQQSCDNDEVLSDMEELDRSSIGRTYSTSLFNKIYYNYNLTCRVQFHIVLVTEVNGTSLEPSENEQLTTHDDSGVVMDEAGQSNHHSEGKEYYHVFMFRLYCT